MSFKATIAGTPSLGRFGHLRRMLTSHWGIDITEAYVGEAVQIGGQGYTAGISFVAPTCNERVRHRLRSGRAYTQEELRATVGPIRDTDTVSQIEFNIAGAGDSFAELCRFCRRYGFELRENATDERVDLDHPEDSVLYSLYHLEGEIGPDQGS